MIGGHNGRFRRDHLPLFFLLRLAPVGRDVHSLALSVQHFLCRLLHCPSSKVCSEGWFGKVVVTRDMLGSCQFPSPNSCHDEKILRAHKELDLALQPVVGFLVPQVGDWIFFSINKQGPCLSAIEENGDDTRLTQLELAFEVMVLLHRILFNLANAARS